MPPQESSSGGSAPQTGPSATPSSSPVPTPLSDIPPPTWPRPGRTQPTPSDYIAGDTIAGRVTTGGSGPCYELVDDDGILYSLHGTAGLTLEEGTYVTAKVAPLTEKVDCGTGRGYALVSFIKQ